MVVAAGAAAAALTRCSAANSFYFFVSTVCLELCPIKENKLSFVRAHGPFCSQADKF